MLNLTEFYSSDIVRCRNYKARKHEELVRTSEMTAKGGPSLLEQQRTEFLTKYAGVILQKDVDFETVSAPDKACHGKMMAFAPT